MKTRLAVAEVMDPISLPLKIEPFWALVGNSVIVTAYRCFIYKGKV